MLLQCFRHPFAALVVFISLVVDVHPVAAEQLAIPDVAYQADDVSADASQDLEPNHAGTGSSAVQGALADSLRLLMLEHSFRIAFHEGTQRELGGNFFGDYKRSVKVPQQWSDGDGWMVNYVGHPMHGAASGFIWLNNEHGAPDPALGFSAHYWKSRARSAAWMTVFSLQFEVGPVSEASIGNVGLDPATVGWVDHVITPIAGFGLLVAEDAIDRYLIRRIESWTTSRVWRAVARSALNPSRALANATGGRVPWYRPTRPLN